ncbi:heterokaryon incompatibility protein-domain-containing protein [Phyllosticta capitalensis]
MHKIGYLWGSAIPLPSLVALACRSRQSDAHVVHPKYRSSTPLPTIAVPASRLPSLAYLIPRTANSSRNGIYKGTFDLHRAIVKPEARQSYSRQVFDGQKQGDVDGQPREVITTVDWEWVISWLEEAPAFPFLEEIPFGFRLIDVEEKKVVRAPSQNLFQYACLSYVWGNVKEFQATRKNIHRLEKPGTLNHERVPATIKDAMTACQRLDIKYLWVDRLCIIQDDDAPNGEKYSQLRHMGSIYHHAAVTLVAMQGVDANSGLNGVSQPLKLDKPTHFDLERSPWAKRGWTYQEAILSHRLVMFAATDIYLEHDGASRMSPSSLRPFAPFFHCKPSYEEAVESYTRRKLGDPNDILNAFHGVCSFWYNEHRYGLPESGFFDAVHWLPLSDERRRRPSSGCNTFPTWSWISVQGGISVQGPVSLSPFFSRARELKELDPSIARTQNPGRGRFYVASWAFVSAIGGKVAMEFPEPEEGSFDCSLAILACNSDCMPVRPPEIASMNPHSGDNWMSLRKRYTLLDLWKTCQGLDQNQSHPSYVTRISNEQKRLAASPGRVLVFSQAASLDIASAHEDPDEHQSSCGVFVRKTIFGMLLRKKRVGVVSFDDRSYKSELRKKTNEIQCIALSISRRPWRDLTINICRGEGEGQSRPIICFMAIETLEGGVSRRIGLGFVNFQDWIELKPTKTSFVLE